jgi:putative PIN family toxin of toxin-antitoxin system
MPDWTELLVVLLDTNILASSLISPQGNEGRILTLARDRRIAIAHSSEMFAEYKIVLQRPKFDFETAKIDELLDIIRQSGRHFRRGRTLRVSPHQADNRFLECAEAAEADFLITGNLRHFPATHGITRIVNARTFLSEFEKTP